MSRSKRVRYGHSDVGNVKLFADTYRSQLLYDHKRKRWLRWAGNWWEPDTTDIVMELAKSVAQLRAQAALKVEDTDRRASQLSWAAKCESRHRIKAIEELARSAPEFADNGEDWDTDPWLLGVPNGVVDLSTGTLRDGKPTDRVSLHTPVVFDPNAECPRWLRFLGEICSGDEELIWLLRRGIGYSLTGSNREQCVFCTYGPGGNGRSTMFETLRYVLGPYAGNVPFSTFERRDRSSIPADVAHTFGKRFVTASETNEDTTINEARLKSMTGTDTQTARYLYGNFFDFRSTGKIWLAFNHKPRITDDTHAMWRRIRLIPFSRTFDPRTEPDLADKLRAEAEGILALAVRDCRDWQRNGLGMPAVVQAATQDYRQESDQLGRFLNDRCQLDPQASIPALALREMYDGWCDEGGEVPFKPPLFVKRLEAKGLKRRQHGEGRRLYWLGVGARAKETLIPVNPLATTPGGLMEKRVSVALTDPGLGHENSEITR